MITPSIPFPPCTNLSDGVPDPDPDGDIQLVEALATAGAANVDNLVHSGDTKALATVGAAQGDNLVHGGDTEALATAGAAQVDNLVHDATDTQQVEALATAGAVHVDNQVHYGDQVETNGEGDLGLGDTLLDVVLATAGAAHVDNHVPDGNPAGVTHGGDRGLATGGLWRIKQRYNLDEGKIRCRCILRKWKFCKSIKTLADGHVTPKLLESRRLVDVENLKQISTDTKGNTDINPDTQEHAQTVQTIPDIRNPSNTRRVAKPFRPSKRKSRPERDKLLVMDTKTAAQTPIPDSPDTSKNVIPKRKRGRPTKSLSLQSTPAQKECLDKYWRDMKFIQNRSSDA